MVVSDFCLPKMYGEIDAQVHKSKVKDVLYQTYHEYVDDYQSQSPNIEQPTAMVPWDVVREGGLWRKDAFPSCCCVPLLFLGLSIGLVADKILKTILMFFEYGVLDFAGRFFEYGVLDFAGSSKRKSLVKDKGDLAVAVAQLL
ncbi:hypothetical protein Pint_18012 [Pistacia integerrima]|uniref:Uncharacterized protein n=1 Tax=Pistacia integerrima TaxID=434235 RepID=A0ACC0YU24_9ROSI|nr:hypothetical protein Pint_18012 [Pistacia integerrima]